MKTYIIVITAITVFLLAMLDMSTIENIKDQIKYTKNRLYESLFPKIEIKENYEEFPDRKFHKFIDMNTVFLEANSLVTPIKSIKFDKNRGIWDKFENKYIDQTINELPNFTLMTYNVWFDKHNYMNRRTALLEILKKKNSDVICLQEVIEPFMAFLQEDDFIKANYYISDSMTDPYNIVMLSKFPLRFYQLTFPTNQNRNLVIGELKIRSKEISRSLIFSTSHFESMNNADFRKDQMSRSFKLLNEFKNSFLVGDFNIDDKLNREELANFDHLFNDSWKFWMQKNPKLSESDGYTYYEDENEPKQRLDRILYGTYADFELKNFEILGKDKITVDPKAKSSSVGTASDHQGLFAEFSAKIEK